MVAEHGLPTVVPVLEPRLPPLGNTFLNWAASAPVGAVRRARSFPGYVSYELGSRAQESGQDRATTRAPVSAAEGGPEVELELKLEAAPQLAQKQRPAALQIAKKEICSKSDETPGGSTATTCFSSSWGEDSTGSASTCEDISSFWPLSPKVAAIGEEASTHSQTPRHGRPAALKAVRDDITTILIKNLPRDILQSELAQEVDRSGFAGWYDFLYMPSAFGTGVGHGYAFVNLLSSQLASEFIDQWHRSCRFRSSTGPLAVLPAHVQGREANLKAWNTTKMRRVRNPNHRPILPKTTGEPGGGIPSHAQQLRQGSQEAVRVAQAAPAAPLAPAGATWPHGSGEWRRVVGLTGCPGYNGLLCRIEGYDAEARVYVAGMFVGGEWIRVRLGRDNLACTGTVPPPPAAPPALHSC